LDATRKGQAAESLAVAYLIEGGLKVLHRNYRTPYGELDIVIRDGSTICFVEVRSRRDERFLTPIESITSLKRQRIANSAQHFLASRQEAVPCRFDVIQVLAPGSSSPEIVWTRDAFRLN